MDCRVELHKRTVKYPTGPKVVYWTLRWWGGDGKRYSESIGKVGELTKAEAETKRREKEIAIGSGRIKRNRPQPMTLGEFFVHDAETVRGTVKPNTVESMKHSAAHARAAWGEHTRLPSLSSAHVGRLKTHLLDTAKVSETTLAKTLRTLKAMLNRALKEGLINENPLAGVRMPKTPARSKRIFSPDETRAMRTVASTLWWKALILLDETTGLRKGELLNLQWSDIDFERRTVRVASKRAGTFVVKNKGTFPLLAWTPKSYEERTVPLPDSTVSVLATVQGESDGSPFVFISLERLGKLAAEVEKKGSLGPNYELVNNLKARFDLIQNNARKLLAKERGVPADELRWQMGSLHDLRRTYGTRMARVIPMHVLKEYMGHAKITTTQEYYLAAETEDADRARQALNALTGEAPSSGRMLDACGSETGSEGRERHAPKSSKPRQNRGLRKRGGRDSNPQPPDRQSGTLTN